MLILRRHQSKLVAMVTDYELRLDEHCPLIVCSIGLSRANIERRDCTTDSRLREKRWRGKQHAKIFLFSSQFTKLQVSFTCDLIFRTMNKFFQVTDFIVFALFTYCLILSILEGSN